MNSYFISIIAISFLLYNFICCPPVNKNDNKNGGDGEAHSPNADIADPLNSLEYHRYLREVVNVLETDEKFKRMIENASVDDIKSGKISHHLDTLNHTLRTQLDELKRKEVERLSALVARKIKLNSLNGKDIEKIIPQHIDHINLDSFDKADLEKLIKQATQDLDEIDKRRREEFKEHEMEKEYDRRKELEKLDEAHRKQAEETHKKEIEDKKHHEKIHHPGSKDQLEEVWADEDKLEPDTFDPSVFFDLHDINGDQELDEVEVEALFQHELDKLYNTSDPAYDPVEREEEMNRMREHVMREIDTNGDKIITKDEFIKGTMAKDFDKDEEWKTLEDEEQFDDKEFNEFAKTHEDDSGEVTPSPHSQQHPQEAAGHQ